MKINFRGILLLGLIGLLLIVISEFFQIASLNILGIVILAVVFIINSRMLIKRIENIENGNK